MKYIEAIDYLENLNIMGMKLGLSNMELLLNHMGNPEKKLKCIHVAGTNGKGSTCAMLRGILTSSGYKTGMYTSPHLECYEERFVIDNEMITQSDFAAEVSYLKEISNKMIALGQGQPTVFEILTAINFHYFLSKQVDILVLEVGLGGRFDATNVIENPILSIITSISLDHTEYLGNTIPEITIEKGGIIKENCPVVLYSQAKIVYNEIERICKEKNAHLYYAKKSNLSISLESLTHSIFSIDNEYFSFKNIELSLIGRHQIANCETVLLSVMTLKSIGYKISEKSIKTALKEIKWSGRMEICGASPICILDGAHNLDGITTLFNSLITHFANKKITLILGILSDKEYKQMVDLLVPLINTVILTEPKNERKLNLDILESVVSVHNKHIYKYENPKNAYTHALSLTDKDDIILVCGSLYLIGEIRKYIYL